jgi:hypothetical protein
VNARASAPNDASDVNSDTARLRTGETGGADGRLRECGWADRIGHERERAAGDAAAAGLLARMGGIEDCDADAAARQQVRRPRACRPRTDNGNVN